MLILPSAACSQVSNAGTTAPVQARIPVGDNSDADGVEVGVYYFPMWHRQPGDPAGGEQFGEWKSIQSAVPRFPGHLQPKVPLWGYEDETDPKVMAKKIGAAADAGIDAFVFDWYYHSAGAFRGTYLERALNDGYLKAPNAARLKFALMWANHGLGTDSPGGVARPEFDALIVRLIKDYFTHPGYWKIGGKPYFSIYEVRTFIDGLGGTDAAAAALRDADAKARAAGLDGIHFNAIESQVRSTPPNDVTLLKTIGFQSATSYVWVHVVGFDDTPPTTDYEHFRENYFLLYDREKDSYDLPYFPNVTMGWDPTPRLAPGRKYSASGSYPDTQVITGNTPDRFLLALRQARQRAAALPPGQRIVTLNAWNEWGEGSYLEPDTLHGTGYLDAVRTVFGETE